MLFLGQFKLQYETQYLMPQDSIIKVRVGAICLKILRKANWN